METFGLHAEADWQATDIRPEGEATRFRLRRRGRDEGDFVVPLAGAHNVRNALAALGAAVAAGADIEGLRSPLAAFRGIRRRLEVRGRVAGVVVYDDFAHHPTAVRATLEALKAAGPGPSDASGVASPTRGRLIAVF